MGSQRVGRSPRSDRMRRKARRAVVACPLPSPSLAALLSFPLHSSGQNGRKELKPLDRDLLSGWKWYLPTRLYRSSNRAGFGLLYRRWGRRNEPHDGISFPTRVSAKALLTAEKDGGLPEFLHYFVYLCPFAHKLSRLSGSRASFGRQRRASSK